MYYWFQLNPPNHTNLLQHRQKYEIVYLETNATYLIFTKIRKRLFGNKGNISNIYYFEVKWYKFKDNCSLEGQSLPYNYFWGILI